MPLAAHLLTHSPLAFSSLVKLLRPSCKCLKPIVRGMSRQHSSSFPASASHSTSSLSQPGHTAVSCTPVSGANSCMATANVSRPIHKSTACQGFVGEATKAATAYYDSDFSWEELRNDPGTIAILKRQAGEAAAAAAADGRIKSTAMQANLAPPPAGPRAEHASQDARAWEAFHARDNATARFYKERRYLLLEFPILAQQDPPLHVLEIGCGCGSALLPVLKANPTCRVTATDVSQTAVGMLSAAAQRLGIAPDRIQAFVADAAAPASSPLNGLEADVCLIIFTLAALRPADMPAMLDEAWQALRPGGLLLIRDHAFLDITHLRAPGNAQLEDKCFTRLDGTHCYYFTTEDLSIRVEAAGFQTLKCSYACTLLRNRKQGLDMKRVFVHGEFKKGKPSYVSDSA